MNSKQDSLYLGSVATFITAFLIALYLGLSMYSAASVSLFFHQVYLLFSSIGRNIPVRYLLGMFMCLQMLLGPVLAYNGLEQFYPPGYRMKVPEAEYFLYVTPAVASFIIGLHLFGKNLDGEFIDKNRLLEFTQKNKYIPVLFICIGFATSLLLNSVPSSLTFIFYLLGNLKFIGLFLIIIGNLNLKLFPLILIVGSIILSSLRSGMFHDLITWLIFVTSVIAIKYRPKVYVKLFFMIIFLFLVVVIQQVKGVYRESIWGRGEQGGIQTFLEAYQKKGQTTDIFNLEALAQSSVRINQGFIITNIMVTVPIKVPFANGSELLELLEAAFLPRFLAPNKLTAGNQELFTKYSGIKLGRGTSMGLSSIGDAYINFGVVGGCFFMFFLGLLYNLVLKAFHKFSKFYPILILFTSLVFYYPIRPDCELQTILGHLVKSCFLLFAFLTIYNKIFFQMPHPRTTNSTVQ